jgi:hypothetical protein
MDMSRFPSAAHLASSAGICPGAHESAGKRKTGKTRQGNPWLKMLLVECGWAAGRARCTYLGAQYARVGCRRGKKRAALAVGHSMPVAVYHMVQDGVPYQDLGPEHFDRLAMTGSCVIMSVAWNNSLTMSPELEGLTSPKGLLTFRGTSGSLKNCA